MPSHTKAKGVISDTLPKAALEVLKGKKDLDDLHLDAPVMVQVPVSCVPSCMTSGCRCLWIWHKGTERSFLWPSWYIDSAWLSQEGLMPVGGWQLLPLCRRTCLALHQMLGSMGCRLHGLLYLNGRYQD